MNGIINQLKQQKESSGAVGTDDVDQINDDDDESSCGKSFSGDELSDGDLKEVQGDILGALKRFDDIYNKASQKNKP